jgi:hypothetical protein
MSELDKLQFEVKRLREENENLRQTFTENFSDSTIVQKNAENIIMKAINMAYDIRIQLKLILESLRGKTYEEGLQIISEFVENNKYFLGNDLRESRMAVHDFVQQIMKEIKE